MKDIIKWSDLSKPKLTSINLELTAHCNYTCDFCLNPDEQFRSKGYISQKLVNKVIDELDENIRVHICGVGEPSLHPEFLEIVLRLRKKFKYVSLVTNGTIFTKYSAKEISSLRLDKIFFSLDFIDPEIYKKIKGGSLDKVFKGLKLYSDSGEYKTEIQVNYLFTRTTTVEELLEAYNKLCLILKNNWCIYIRQIKDLAGEVNIETSNDEDELDKTLKKYVNKHFIVENWNRYLENTNFVNEDPKICRHIYKYYMLLWNGDVVPCCQDFNAQLKLFNVLDTNYNLSQLFTTNIYKSFFVDMEKLNYSKYPICKACKDYYRA